MTPIAEVLLLWLSTRKAGRARVSEAARALSFAVGGGRTLASASDELERAGLLAHQKDGRAEAVRMSELGAKRARALLKSDAKVTWASVRRALLGRALGKDLARVDAGSLSRSIVASRERVSDVRTLDALAWRAIGVESDAPFTRKAALVEVLRKKLDGARVRDPQAGLRMLAAKHVGARRPDGEGLSTAVLQTWLAGAGSNDVTPSEALKAFAARVNDATRAAKTGRFGDSKVFIAHVHRAFADLDRDAFKARLVEAQREGLVALSRADLVEAMDPDDVRDSETRYLNATFHFVRA